MEYIIPIIEFLYVKGKKLFINLGVSFLLASTVFYVCPEVKAGDFNNILSSIINLLGILLGFTASIFSLILTVNIPSIKEAKNHKINKRIFNKDLSLFDSLTISFIFLIFLFGALLLFNFLIPFFLPKIPQKSQAIFSIDVFFIAFSVLLLMRTLLDFYFIFTKNNNDNSNS